MEKKEKEETEVITINKKLPTVVISGDAMVCENEEVYLNFDFTGVAPWNVTLSNGASFTTNENPYKYQVNESGEYTVASLSDANAEAEASGMVGKATINIIKIICKDY
mgnify:CR=1 FL=1